MKVKAVLVEDEDENDDEEDFANVEADPPSLKAMADRRGDGGLARARSLGR